MTFNTGVEHDKRQRTQTPTSVEVGQFLARLVLQVGQALLTPVLRQLGVGEVHLVVQVEGVLHGQRGDGGRGIAEGVLAPVAVQVLAGILGDDGRLVGQAGRGRWEALVGTDLGQDIEGVNELGQDTEGVNELGQDTEGVNELGQDTEGVKELGQDTEGVKELGQDTEGVKELGHDTEGANERRTKE